MIKEKLVFERKEDYKGFNVKAWFLEKPDDRDALIEIFKDGELLRQFNFPAYKIWNIAAHFEDIVEGELQNSDSGYQAAAWNGISGAVILIPKEQKDETSVATKMPNEQNDGKQK